MSALDSMNVDTPLEIFTTVTVQEPREYTIHATRDDESENWYIVVTGQDGLRCYDGWWRDSAHRTRAEVLQEAAEGSCFGVFNAAPAATAQQSLQVASEAAPQVAAPADAPQREAETDCTAASEDVLVFAIQVEKMLCAKLGIPWTTTGISIESLIQRLAAPQVAAPGPIVRHEMRTRNRRRGGEWGKWDLCSEELAAQVLLNNENGDDWEAEVRGLYAAAPAAPGGVPEAPRDVPLALKRFEDMVRRQACGDRSMQAVNESRAELLDAFAAPAPVDGGAAGVRPQRLQWEDAPEWAQWLAVDRTGCWHWYERRPEYQRGEWCSWGQVDRAFPRGGWIGSLEARPELDADRSARAGAPSASGEAA